MNTQKSNKLVPMRVYPEFRKWAKLESAQCGLPLTRWSEEWAKKQMKAKEKNGFKIGF